MNKRFALIAAGYFLITVLSGCSMIAEVGKGVAGVSTKVLEDKRRDALKKSFALGYNDCYAKVKDILAKDSISVKDSSDKEVVIKPYIYAEDPKKKMIAIYLSQADTTPVGIFFTEEQAGNTLVEVSSPSVYAKEEISKKIFSGIDALIKPKIIEEKKSNVEEKTNN